MPYYVIAIIAVLIILFLILIQVSAKVKKPIRKALLSMIVGILSLLAVNLFSSFTGVSLPVSMLSLGISAVGGIPGVTTMLILNMIL